MRQFVTRSFAIALLALSACAPTATPGSTSSSGSGPAPVPSSPAEWVALAKPSASHRLLGAFVGKWASRISFWSTPDAAPQVSSGASETKWILGDRFTQEDFSGTAAGEKFKGMGITGFDNGSRRFQTVWADSMSTTIATSVGTYDPDDQVYTFTGTVYDPIKGADKQTRSTIKFLSPDRYVFTMFDHHPIVGDYKALEIEYTRQ